MNHPPKIFVLLISVVLTGCASLDKYSFETFGRPKERQEVHAMDNRSDQLALIYADYVAQLLEGRATGSRVTRELSDSSLVAGGTLVGAQQTLAIAASSVAGIGIGMVIAHELQGVFNARGRSEAFADAAYLIRQAQSEYRQFNPNPSSNKLTENGAILVSRVDGALYAARKTLNGRMPALRDLQQATQPMTRAGANRTESGSPQTIFPAAGDNPRQAATSQQEALNARIVVAQGKSVDRVKHASPQEIAELNARLRSLEESRPVRISFNALADQMDENAGHDPVKMEAAYTALLNDQEVKAAGVPTMNPSADDINAFLRGKTAQKPTPEQTKAILAAAARLAKNNQPLLTN